MKQFITFVLLIIGYTVSGQTSLSFSTIPTTQPDLIKPGAGAEQWNQQNTVNIPVNGTNTQRLDAYWRFRFADFCPYNSPQGTYSFTAFDAQIHDAINKKQKFSFGIMNQCGGCGPIATVGGAGIDYPLFLHTLMQAETPKDWTSGGVWIPNVNSPSWLSVWRDMNIAINDHIMNTTYSGVRYRDVIRYIDVRGIGDYGEWTNRVFDGPSGTVATVASLDTMINATVKRYPNFKCVGMVAMFDNMSLQNTLMPTAVGYYALTVTNSKGLMGWRRDSWGWTDPYLSLWTNNNTGSFNGLNFDTAIMNRWKYAPIVGEPADLNNAGTGTSAFANLPGQMLQYGVNSFGNGNLDANASNNTAKNNYRAAAYNAGYRLVLTGGSTTTSPQSGGAFNVTLSWQNIGNTPTYENWNVTYELRSGSTVAWTGTSAFDPFLFLPGTPVAKSDNFTITGVVAGTYDLYLIVKDPNGFRSPLPLAISGRNADGSYLLRSGIGVVSTGTPIAYAGPDQSILLPTSSVLLDGTGSSGTITSYAWTKISGPNTPTITSPTASTTTVTGLIQGTYVFQLSVNSGVSTSNVTIVVNPEPPAVANAGSDQFITLPVSGCTLNGSLSSGTITAYAWYQVSGPSASVISSPSAVSTTASGLVQGTYIFRLIVNGGASSDDVVVIVGPQGNNIFTNQIPSSSTNNDGFGGHEVGLKFRSSVAGYITGLRFYKTTGNAGTHIGELYSSAGTRLAQATFTGESATGWQYVVLSSPIPIQSNTTYMAAYFSSLGNYVEDNNYFTGHSVANGPLTALAAETDGGNAPYTYTNSPAFPSVYYLDANYWVDVVFTSNQPPVAVITGSGSITLPTNSITLSGTSSTDADGTIVSYLWTNISGPNTPTIGTPSASSCNITGLIAGTYIFQLRVIDNLGAAATTTKTVIVNPSANIPPVAVISGLSSITLPTNSINLDGSSSHDPDGTVSSYSWSFVSGPQGSGFSSFTNSTTILTNLILGTYVIKLTVTDNNDATGTVNKTIVVNPMPPPIKNYFIIRPGHKPFFR